MLKKKLSTRGKPVDLSEIHNLTMESKNIDIELCNLQSESKKLSKMIGNKISKSDNKECEEFNNLKKERK